MIRISCTNCKTILSIDDAFAGGVCRCQHCGTIQTVPAQARDTAKVSSAGQAMGGHKSLYQSGAQAGSGSGLDELAGIVVSSGLQSSRLTRKPKTDQGKPGKQNLMPFIIGATVLVAILLVIIVVLLSRNTASPVSPVSSANPQTGAASPVAVDTPSFCGVPLTGNTIIYLLDCGSSSSGYLGDLKDATLKSIGSLGSDRKFQILFWNNGTDGAYPQNTTTYANKENIASAAKVIEDVYPFGQSDVKASLQLALAQHPDVINLATGKGFDLNNAWLDSIMMLRGSSPVKINTFYLITNLGDESEELKKLAAQTGGTYHEINSGDLRTFGQ